MSGTSDYANDRAQIEDLLSRYFFALDWLDADAYAATFAPDGVLDWAGGVVKGREAIRNEARGMQTFFARRDAADAPLRPARLRHFMTNFVLSVAGARAHGCAYWFELENAVRGRWPYVGGYGHAEDEYVRQDGEWLIAHRKIFNEVLESRTAPPDNPAAARDCTPHS